MEKNLIDTVINNGYCVGCGACAFVCGKEAKMIFQPGGFYLPGPLESLDERCTSVCPFYSGNPDESQLGEQLYNASGVHHDSHLGYYLAAFAGFVSEGRYRENGSSGGMVSWIASKLLDANMVDKIIHVGPSENGGDALYSYRVSSTQSDIARGAKSKYYPIEMSEMLTYISTNAYRYAVVGIPCFIKALHLVAEQNQVIKSRVVYTIGLVCGHLKTDRFAKAMSWEMGINPDSLSSFDFRVKTLVAPADTYKVEAIGISGSKRVKKEAFVRDLLVSNWGYGYFKLNACDYCDDVLSETAHISIGDAWLPEYTKDPGGTNIVVVRDKDLLTLLENSSRELCLEPVSSEIVYQTQAGGFRHRRAGLAHRLYLKDVQGKWRPQKRVQPLYEANKRRRRIIEMRERIAFESHLAYDDAAESGDFQVLRNRMAPIIKKYERLYTISLKERVWRKLARIARLLVNSASRLRQTER